MKIHGLVVCVHYADLFRRAINRWKSLASLTVVTSLTDADTMELCARHGAVPYSTDAFYLRGAHFNKGAAMQEARRFMPDSDWHLFFDADVIPPEDWIDIVAQCNPQAGHLYGARRRHEDGRPIADGEIAGFFQLFHSSDPAGRQPLDTHWTHGGNYDSRFMQRWPSTMKHFLPLTCVHLGETGRNWAGRGNDAVMKAIRDERKKRGGWDHERIQ